MKAIEISARTDKNGKLNINYPLETKNKKVRVIILLAENEDEQDKENL